jgi:tRNA(adenine34) deaminase
MDEKILSEKNITECVCDSDESFMREAMREASLAESEDEVPIGAVAVKDGKIIARAYNTREGSRCATHHAEILAIERACAALGGWRLPGVTLYVTLEPCAMCAGAIINARIPRVVYGASDLRFGALGSLVDLSEIPFNHKPEVARGVLKEECADMLSSYFKRKRK